ncbi:hypothetical protein [Burkholderia sp. Bp8990]|uniref:hypothetical protein n=2 Tax=unclassified Burkholderia TaxID=2613784 RepID=UPI001C893797|nr:hypothetical protein [Burkholderia sp. Bp8990]
MSIRIAPVGSVMPSSRPMPVRALQPSGQTRTCEVQMRIVRAIRPIKRRQGWHYVPPPVESCPIGQVLDDQNAQRNVFLA